VNKVCNNDQTVQVGFILHYCMLPCPGISLLFVQILLYVFLASIRVHLFPSIEALLSCRPLVDSEALGLNTQTNTTLTNIHT